MWRLKQLMPNSKDQGGLEGKTVEVGSQKLQVRSTIAEGGFSCVYLARDSSQPGKQYALKHIICNDGESLDLVKKEVAVMRILRGHPNVVSLQAQTVYDLGRTKECFLVLEFCEKSLVNVLESRGAAYFDEKQILVIFRDICNAVYAMHCQSPPIAHRDLKAENVLMGADGVWKLCDFGSTSTNHKRFERPEEMGIEEDIIRKHTTPAYRAPEMWDLYRRDLISEKVDIWALGCLLYRIAYLKSAFDGESKLQILNGNYRIPELPRYSSSLTDLIKDMLSAAPEVRPDILQIWRRVNELLPSDLRKSNPDRPSSVATSEVSAPTDSREHGTPPPTRRAPLPARSPPPPPSSKEQDRSSPVTQSDSKAVEVCNSGSSVGAFWSTQYAQESVVVPDKGPVFDKDPGFESAFKPRSHSPDTHPKEVSSNTSPPKGHSLKTAPHSKRSVMSNFTKKVHGSSQPTSGQGFDEINSDMHHMRFSSEDNVEGVESLSKVSPMKTVASESEGPFRDDSFNAFVADFDYSKGTSGSSLCARENFQSVDKLKEELDKVRREKAEITSKYEKLTAICRSQRQEIQELKHALSTGTVQSFPAINKEQRQRPISGNLPPGSQQLEKTEASIWELQENMSSSELPTQASDAKGWQAFPESQPTQLSKSPPSSARILSGVSTGGHASLDDIGTASNGYRRQQHGTGVDNVSTGDSWGFVQDSFASTNNNPQTSKPSGQASAKDESRGHPPAHISNISKSESWSSRSLTKTQPAGWAGF